MSLSILNDSVRAVTEKRFARFSAALPDATWFGAEWAQKIVDEVGEIRAAVHQVHGVNIRFVIWAGQQGLLEDKIAMNAAGLLKGGPMFYALDSTDPQKLKSIVDDMQQRAQEPIAKLLPATLVVGAASDSISPEPVMNVEKLLFLFDKFRLPAQANFLFMSTPGSSLSKLAESRALRNVPLPASGGDALYALALAGRDLQEWTDGGVLSEADKADALKLCSFLQAQKEAGRNKITLFLPRSWTAVGPWTKIILEEVPGVKIVIGEKFNGRTYRKPSAPNQDRLFLAVQRKGEPHPEATGITAVRGAGYPIAFLTFAAKGPLARYMHFMRYAASSLGFSGNTEARPQGSVELFNSLTAEIFSRSKQVGGITETNAWKALASGRWWRGTVSPESPESLAGALRDGSTRGKFHFGEIRFFGDMRYSEEGHLMRRALETAAQRIFRVKLKMPVDIGEEAAISDTGQSFSLLVLALDQAHFPTAGYEPDYHIAQFLAARVALERKHRINRAILVKDLSSESIAALEEFFTETAALLEIQ